MVHSNTVQAAATKDLYVAVQDKRTILDKYQK